MVGDEEIGSGDGAGLDLKRVIEEFQDYLAPKLDTYECAIYLDVFHHSRLEGRDEVVIGFKSARREMCFGVGEHGSPMSESTCYEKLRSLQTKECIENPGSVRGGTKVRLRLPAEIPNLVPPPPSLRAFELEEIDFFTDPKNRLAILRREGSSCFYCLRQLNTSDYVIEHVVSRPDGDNSYRNLVAACLGCNNRKGPTPADEYLRKLYREGYLNPDEFQDRTVALKRLQDGEIRPQV